MFTNHSFVCISYISVPLVHKSPWSIVLEVSDKIKIKNMPKKIMFVISLWKENVL